MRGFLLFQLLRKRVYALLPGIALLVACVTNPVTGERQFSIVSTAEELQIGQEYYAPMLQSEGGLYRLDPQLTAYVNQVGQRLARVSDRQLPYEFAVINSSVPNAWALPGGKIAINRGLLVEMNSEAELAAVLSHEIVHAAARHGALAQSRALLLQGVLLVGVIALGDSDYAGLAVLGLAVGVQLISQRYSREAELESDRYGMVYMQRAGYNPQGAVALQETFVRLNDGRNPGWLEGLFSSHPPSPERVNANRATAASLPAGGDLGQANYQAMTANLRRQQPAYDAIDSGREALEAGRLQEARTFADQAIALLPQEAQGYALRGDVLRRQQRHREAADDYTRALTRDPDFFYYSLQRGLSRIDLNELTGARDDLLRSSLLFPTVSAYYGLGRVAERQGQLTVAKDYYRQAADSPSEEGKAAQRALLRLDLADNPNAYLQAVYGFNNLGQLILEIRNPQPVAVSSLLVEIRYRNAAGQLQTLNLQFQGSLAAESSLRETLSGYPALNNAREVQVRLVTARVAN